MSSLQIVLIVAGALLVIGVIVYNNWQERRLKREARRAPAGDPKAARAAERVEPTLATRAASSAAGDAAVAFRPGNEIDGTFEPPLEVIAAPAGWGDDGQRHTALETKAECCRNGEHEVHV